MAAPQKPHNIRLGKRGEHIAVQWLEARHFRILLRNYRQGRWEVDIVAEKNAVLHLIEVKARVKTHYGWPEEYISRGKLQQMTAIGELLLDKYPGCREVQLYLLAITGSKYQLVIFFEEIG